MYPTLDVIVMRTITLYKNTSNLPKLDLTQFHIPLVVGSNNGFYTGRILFRDTPAYFAVESEVEKKLENIPTITDVVVVSASGEKHAPIILSTAKKHGKNTFLISSSKKSSGRDIADDSIVMPKIEEPYTYNTSTYFGYMLAETPDLNLTSLQSFLTGTLTESLKDIDFRNYSSFFLVIPDQFVLIREMFEVKFIELFGRKVARDVFSYEQMKHATTVVQDEEELFICFGNDTGIKYGEHQIDLPVFTEISQKQEDQGGKIFSKGAYKSVSDGEINLSNEEIRSFSEISTSYAAMMLVGYYTIGKIQLAFPPYFMDSIDDYCVRARELSGFKISPIVRVN